MKVLVITGDKKFGQGHERYALQREVVDDLVVVYWGRGSLWPSVPLGHFDVVTAQDPFWRGLFASYVAWRKMAKCNVQVHTDLSVYVGVRRLLMRWVLQHADSVRVVSEKIKGQVRALGVQTKVSVLPVYIDIIPVSTVVHREHAQPTILWIGRFEKEKNPLEAFAVLKEVQKAGVNAQLIMLGAGSMQHDIEAYANNNPTVTLVGWQNPLDYLAIADVVLCTSLHESFGASIIEALAAGVPVVAPDVGIAKEAGATIVPRSELHKGVIEVLNTKQKATLRIPLLNKEAWQKAWLASLL